MSVIVYDSTDIIILDIHQYLMKRHNTKCLNSLKKKNLLDYLAFARKEVFINH